jgi:protein TonB
VISGGGGTSTGEMKNRYVSEQYEYIKALIQKSLVYPKRARRMGWTGRVLVSFDILEDGHVAGERIINSSGHALLDDNVIDTIRNVAPFPRPPGRAKLEISFTYELH